MSDRKELWAITAPEHSVNVSHLSGSGCSTCHILSHLHIKAQRFLSSLCRLASGHLFLRFPVSISSLISAGALCSWSSHRCIMTWTKRTVFWIPAMVSGAASDSRCISCVALLGWGSVTHCWKGQLFYWDCSIHLSAHKGWTLIGVEFIFYRFSVTFHGRSLQCQRWPPALQEK